MERRGIMQAIRLEAGMELAAYSTEQLQEELERRKVKDSAAHTRCMERVAAMLATVFGFIIVLMALVFVVCAGYAL